MIKYLVVGDIHERIHQVEKAISLFLKDNYDKVVFIGDFCDSFDHNKKTLLKTLNLVISFKKQYRDKVILLYGNHEIHYLFSPLYRATGFQSDSLYEVKNNLEQNNQLFDWYHYQNGYLFSHAGITNKWINQVKSEFKHFDNELPLLENISRLSETGQGLDLLCNSGFDRGGKGHSGLLWTDKTTLIEDAYFDKQIKYQIVGHTFVPHITKIGNLFFTDCLGNTSEFLTLYI